MSAAPNLDPTVIRGNQTTHFPHMLGTVNAHSVRYRIAIDSSYLSQSVAVVDVWSPETLSWNEVWSLNLGAEFIVARGVEHDKESASTHSNVLASVHHRRGSEFVAKSWQKVVTKLHYKALEVLG